MCATSAMCFAISKKLYLSETATTHVTWIFISPAGTLPASQSSSYKASCSIKPGTPSPPEPWSSLKPHSDLGRTHPCEDVYANCVLMAKIQAYFMDSFRHAFTFAGYVGCFSPTSFQYLHDGEDRLSSNTFASHEPTI